MLRKQLDNASGSDLLDYIKGILKHTEKVLESKDLDKRGTYSLLIAIIKLEKNPKQVGGTFAPNTDDIRSCIDDIILILDFIEVNKQKVLNEIEQIRNQYDL